MTDKKHRHHERAPEAPADAVASDTDASAGSPAAASPTAGSPTAELAETRDKYLRLAAEFDNFKKRTARDRADTWSKAQADVVTRLIDAVDDLARFAHVDPATTDAKTIHDGVDLIERKLWKQLEALGVSRVDQTGVPFDPNVHEAVTTQPAATAEQDHTVGAVLQGGYKLGETLLRPARVIVLQWTAPEAQA